MNQLCRVCGEPAAGFHFGAFTCEGCKSFFGRTYNNVSSLGDCKNGGRCVINKKNRTSCKACRLRKCLVVGMSKSGSRYGRRSNWFKIHCLLDDPGSSPPGTPTDLGSEVGYWGRGASEDESDTVDVCGTDTPHHSPRRTSPALSSPDSHASDNSVEAAPRPPPGLEYLSLYQKFSVLPSSGLYSGPALNPLLLTHLPLSVSPYSNHPFDPYLQQAFHGTRPHVSAYYSRGYNTNNTPAFRSLQVTPPQSINTNKPSTATRHFTLPTKRLAEDPLVLPSIKRMRQLAENESQIFSKPTLSSTTELSTEFTSLSKRITCRGSDEYKTSGGETRPSSSCEEDREEDSPIDLSVKATVSRSHHTRWLEEERSEPDNSIILDLSIKSRSVDHVETVRRQSFMHEKPQNFRTQSDSKCRMTMSPPGEFSSSVDSQNPSGNTTITSSPPPLSSI
ncbi:uncharacterized protein LOC121854996 [Homarus americanus]|uniref:Embryonic gonad-like 4 n=1 Tax=Homarus americanus TaxID=6706 RepID=A0A8J5JLP8_HOMAM|nr:uncharacterized protein LOC121854996 [Homarus americanus]KAG7155454.1 embryonic gonad-like 4 [Homarus americanus]